MALRSFVLRCMVAGWLVAAPAVPHASAQGCAQCKDNTAAMPQKTVSAYREAIVVLIVGGGTVFCAAVFMMRRNP